MKSVLCNIFRSYNKLSFDDMYVKKKYSLKLFFIQIMLNRIFYNTITISVFNVLNKGGRFNV